MPSPSLNGTQFPAPMRHHGTPPNNRSSLALNPLSPPISPPISPSSSRDGPEDVNELRETLTEMRDGLTKFFKKSQIPGAVALALTNLALTAISFKTGGKFAAFDSAFYTGGALMATGDCLRDPKKNAQDMYKLLTEMGAPGVIITGLISALSGKDDNWSKTGKGFEKYAMTFALSTALTQATDTLSPLLSGDKPKGFNITPPNFDALDDMERGGVSEEAREEKREEVRKKRNAFLKSLGFIVPSVLANTGALKQMCSFKNPLNGEAIPPVVMGAVDGATMSGFLEVWKTVCDPKMSYKDTVRKIQDLCLSIPFACAGEVALQFTPKDHPIASVAATTTSALLLMGVVRHIMNKKTQDNTNPYDSLSPAGCDIENLPPADARNAHSNIWGNNSASPYADAYNAYNALQGDEGSGDDNISNNVMERLNSAFMYLRGRGITREDADNAMSVAVAASAEESKIADMV